MTNLSLMTLLVSQRVCAARALMRGGGEDQQIIRNLVQNHHLIERTHTNRDNGIDSHTWSENPHDGWTDRVPQKAPTSTVYIFSSQDTTFTMAFTRIK